MSKTGKGSAAPTATKSAEAETATSIVEDILREQRLAIVAVEESRHKLLSPDVATDPPVAETEGLMDALMRVRKNAIEIGTLAGAIRDTL